MTNSTRRGCSEDQFVYYQYGAPSLIYYQTDHDNFDLPLAKKKPSTIQATQQQFNRAQFLWNVPFEHGLNKSRKRRERTHVEARSQKAKGKTKKLMKRRKKVDRPTRSKADPSNDGLFKIRSEYRKKRENPSLSYQRHAMLLKLQKEFRDDDTKSLKTLKRKVKSLLSPGANSDVVENYTIYDYPYIPAYVATGKPTHLRLSREQQVETRKYSLERSFSDPAYLAPFGIDTLRTLEAETGHSVEKTLLRNESTGCSSQGNCLVVLSCPCLPCSQKPQSKRSLCLFHPKGTVMDRLCVSNLIPPEGQENAGHIFQKASSKMFRDFRVMTTHALANFPNEINLGQTIVEVKQSGTWNVKNPQCMFVVRTATFVSFLEASVLKYYNPRYGDYDIAEDVCWGNYKLQEKHRIDLRSLSLSNPHRSFLPTSLACHPEYGNMCAGSKFAFSTRSTQGNHNEIHHCLHETDHDLHRTKHSFLSLKDISSIEFTSSHPMCLWSAATSYVRPALSRDVQSRQPMLGTGSSLYTVDLRTNAATFQWSPSAEEMVTEGLHSISCIMTDWQRESTVFVSSNSAGKTWEIDARMPCRSVNVWSLSYSSEDASLTMNNRGFYRGRSSLITKPIEIGLTRAVATAAPPYIASDTTPGSYGFHILQQPLSPPIFQAECVQSIAAPDLNFANTSSIAASSVFSAPEISNDVHLCGIAAFRVPYTLFDQNSPTEAATSSSDLLCSLTLTSKGDLYCYSLLESKQCPDTLLESSSLPVGVKVLRVPEEIDGRMKYLRHKHWKPTGGMNLKLYLTNHLPVAREEVAVNECSKSSSALIYKSTEARTEGPTTAKEKHMERAIAIDENDACDFQTDKSDLSLSVDSKLGGNKAVLIPAAMGKKANKGVKFHRAVEFEATLEQQSDLSEGLLKSASELWGNEDTIT
eukprot:scaffold3598_cov115-Cylindrotheca_fusiformis.AAC.19